MADKPQVLKLLHDFFQDTDYKFLGWDEQSLATLIDNLISNEAAVLFVDDTVSGCIGGYVTPFWINLHKKAAQELFWYVDKSRRGSKVAIGLLNAFEKWAVEQQADFIAMSSTTNLDPSGVGSLYKRKGYQPADISYIKEV
jgi:GNAT superfamily N-acetyltransferase